MFSGRCVVCLSGSLRYSCTVQIPSQTTDGETKPTWATHADGIPASRRHLRGNEVTWDDQKLPLSAEEVVMRWRGDLYPEMRLRFPTSGSDDVLEIVDLGDRAGDRQWLTLICNRLRST